MTSVAWLTDVHLDFLPIEQARRFAQQVASVEPDVVLIGGDIAEFTDLESTLHLLEAEIARPIYFVLGNHDFYRSSIGHVRNRVSEMTRTSQWLRWLPAVGLVELAPGTALVGHDGWGDGRLGAGVRSRAELNDSALIRDFLMLSKDDYFARLRSLGDEAARYLGGVLPEALERFRKVFVLTHIPPFKESCWHQGRISDDDFLPYFTCKAVGDLIGRLAQRYPRTQIEVLCGHTHGQGTVQLTPNLLVRTGGATYGSPEIQSVFSVD